MENLLLRIGSSTGWITDKPRELEIDLCRPGECDTEYVSASTSPSPQLTVLEAELHKLNRELHGLRAGVEYVSRRARELETRVICERSVGERLSTTLPRSTARIVGPQSPLDTGEVAVRAACAHLVCRVTSMKAHNDHWHAVGTIQSGHVKPEYWSGKTLRPMDKTVPALLTFHGSQQFGYVRAASA